jgi:transcriptional regulator with XRE-family HTH domain
MTLGQLCKEYRESIGCTQKMVADDLKMSVTNISMFECGKNRNLNILLWYTSHGMELPDGRYE